MKGCADLQSTPPVDWQVICEQVSPSYKPQVPPQFLNKKLVQGERKGPLGLLANSGDVIAVPDATTRGICMVILLNISKPCLACPTGLLMTSSTL
jgi:hypothetical protein